MIDPEQAMEVARAAAEAGGRRALEHFRSDVEITRKTDASPVTSADHAAEAEILAVIGRAFPDHDILAEESGHHRRGSRFRWIVDPLDGTRGFIRGHVFWGPLVALQDGRETIAGAMVLPVLGESYIAGRGLGTWCNGHRLRVSSVDDWPEAVVSLGQLDALLTPPHGSGVHELIAGAWSARAYGDLAGCALLLRSQADAWLESGVRIWDLAPQQVLVEEAGGRFTDFSGTATCASGQAAATNGPLHDHVLRKLRVNPGL